MREHEYRLEHGSYYFYTINNGGKLKIDTQLVFMTDEVAICFDKEEGIMLKNGIPKNVNEWQAQAIKKFKDSGFNDMADNLVIIEGCFPVEELNRLISTSTYFPIFYKKLMNNDIKPAKPFQFK